MKLSKIIWFIIITFLTMENLYMDERYTVSAQDVDDKKWVLVETIINPENSPLSQETTDGPFSGSTSRRSFSPISLTLESHSVTSDIWMYDTNFVFTWDEIPTELVPSESITLGMTLSAFWTINESAFYTPANWWPNPPMTGAYKAVDYRAVFFSLITEIGVEDDSDVLIGPPSWESTGSPARGDTELTKNEIKSFSLSVPPIIDIEPEIETLIIYVEISGWRPVKWVYRASELSSPQRQPMFSVDPAEGFPDDVILCHGFNFNSNAEVILTWDSPSGLILGQNYIDADGYFGEHIEIPTDADPGNHTVFAKSGTTVLSDDVLVKNVRLPVIFLPGVAGSQLYQKGSALTGDWQLWPLSPSLKSRENLILDPQGQGPDGIEIIAPDIIRYVIWPDVVQHVPWVRGKLAIYGPFIEEMVSWGYEKEKDLFVFPYDWRFDNLNHVDVLDDLVEKALKVTGQEKVVLIGHSMGGIVARAYMAESTRAEKVDTFITMGTPHLGSPKVFYALTMGYTFGNPTVNPNLMKLLCQNAPAAYQLIPWVEFIEEGPTKNNWSLDEAYSVWYHSTTLIKSWLLPDTYKTSEDWPWTLNPNLVASARIFQDYLGRTAPGGVDTFTIIGIGQATLSKYSVHEPYWYVHRLSHGILKEKGNTSTRRWFEPIFGDGDGTVPLWSAEGLLGDVKFYIQDRPGNSSDHGALPLNKDVQYLVKHILEGTVDTRWFPKRDITDLNQKDVIGFELHSSANLHIIDSEGHHMGLNEYGAIDEGIPGGTFLNMDGIEYAAIFNASNSYQVRLLGIEDGEFTLTMNVTSDGRKLDIIYPEVRVENGTTAEFDILSVQKILDKIPSMTVKNGEETTIVNPIARSSEPEPTPSPKPESPDSEGRIVHDHILSKSVDEYGDPSRISSSFSADGFVYSWVHFDGLEEGDILSWAFLGPNSIETVNEFLVEISGEDIIYSWIDLNVYNSKQIIGLWEVVVFANGEEIDSKYFEVEKVQNGIPSFPSESVFIGLIIGLAIWWYRARTLIPKLSRMHTI